jgi:hypothetical protein
MYFMCFAKFCGSVLFSCLFMQGSGSKVRGSLSGHQTKSIVSIVDVRLFPRHWSVFIVEISLTFWTVCITLSDFI